MPINMCSSVESLVYLPDKHALLCILLYVYMLYVTISLQKLEIRVWELFPD